MAQEVLRQSNFNGGELAPSAVGRRDLKAYASSLALAVNCKITPEGPLLRRGGFRHVDMIRRRLEPVVLETATLTAPNGGVAGDVLGFGGMETATAVGSTDGYVVLEIDFGAPTEVAMFDLIDFVAVEPSLGDPDPLPDPPPFQYPWERPELIAV